MNVWKTVAVLATVLALGGLAFVQTSAFDGRFLKPGTVALPKLATQDSGTLLGNNTGSAASPTALTAAQVKTLLSLAIPDTTGLQAALDGKLNLTGGTLTGTLTLNNGANSLKLTAGSQDHTYVEFYARTASPGVQSGYFGFPGAGSADLYFANSLSGGNIVLNTTGGGKLYTNGNTLLDSSDPRILYQEGLLSARPAAAAANSGLWYFASDIAGGTLYRSTGSAWQAVSPGLTQGLPSSLKASLPAPSAGNKGSVYFVSDENSGLGSLAYSDGAAWQYPSVGEVALTGYTSLASALAVTTANKQRLVIPPGTYTLSSPVTLPDYTDLECMAGATFRPETATNSVFLIQASRLRLRGCAVDTSNQGSYSGIAVDVQGTTDAGDRYAFTVDGLYINSNFTQNGTCLRLFSAGSGSTPQWISQTRWNNVSCRGFATGLLLQTTGGIANDYINGNVFSNFFATANTVQIKVDARTDAEVSRNIFPNFNLQTGSTTSRGITVSGKSQANRFDGVTWDWGGANSGVTGRIAYEITGLGNSYTEPIFNRISDLGFSWDSAQIAIAPRNYFETKGNTASPLENQIALPGSDENRAMIGDQDDILAGATYRYTVSTVSQSVAPTCRGGSLATLFAPHGKCTWNMPANGSVTLRVDLNPDGQGYDYIDTIGAQYIGSGEQPVGVTIQTGDTAPALTTALTTTANVAMYSLYQNIGLGGNLQVRYIDFTFSRPTAGNLSVQRLFARGLIRKGPFWPGGASRSVQFNNGGQLYGGAANVDITSEGNLQLSPSYTTSTPTTPASGLTQFSRRRAGRDLPAFVGSSGQSSSLQPLLATNKTAYALPLGNSTTIGGWGFSNTAQGTATAANVATTNARTWSRRLMYASAATAGASAGWRNNTAQYGLGNAAGRGGFFYVIRFGIAQTQTGWRFNSSLSSTTGAFASAEPATVLNQIAIVKNSTDTNFQAIASGGTAGTPVDTGIAPNTTDVFEMRLYSAPNSGTVSLSLQNVTTGALYETTYSTSLPSNTTLLTPQLWMDNGATAAAVQVELVSAYMETDN